MTAQIAETEIPPREKMSEGGIASRPRRLVKLHYLELTADSEIQPRAELDTRYVQGLADDIINGAEMPALEAFDDGDKKWLSRGFHRIAAAKESNNPQVTVILFEGTRRDAQEYALGSNSRHGLRRTNADKRREVGIALELWPEKSDRAIAAELCVSQPFVSGMRKASGDNGYHLNGENGDSQVATVATSTANGVSSRTGQDGKKYPAKGKSESTQAPADDPYFTDGEEPDDEPPSDDYDEPESTPEPTLEQRAAQAETIHDTLSDKKDEDDLTDAEWLATLPIWRVLSQRQHRGIILREDLLGMRSLWKAKETFAHHARRAFNMKAARNTPAQARVVGLAELVHPRDWQVCPPCKGNGCAKCDQSGYAVNGAGISPTRVEGGEVAL